MLSSAWDIRRMSNLRGALINSVAIIPWRRDIRVLCEHPVDTRRVSRSAALHLSRCNRPPVAYPWGCTRGRIDYSRRKAPHYRSFPFYLFSILYSRVGHLNASSSSASPSMGPVLFFSSRARGHLSSSSTFDHARSLFFSLKRPPSSVSGIHRRPLSRVSVFAQHIIYRPQLVMRQKTCWFPLRTAPRATSRRRGDPWRSASASADNRSPSPRSGEAPLRGRGMALSR